MAKDYKFSIGERVWYSVGGGASPRYIVDILPRSIGNRINTLDFAKARYIISPSKLGTDLSTVHECYLYKMTPESEGSQS